MLVLNISNSHISGSIPERFFIGNAVNSLQALFLYNNELTGSILPSMGNLKNLINLNLGNNYLTGTIPVALHCIGNGSNGGFKSLDLSNNQLVGTIPTELSNWGGLQTMLLKNNKLENAGLFDFLVSPILGQPWFPQLQTLDISSNMFTGTLPEAVFNDFSNSLTMFAASQNCFHGSIPGSICNATKLQTLSLTALNSGEGCRSYISLFNWKFPGFLAEETMSGSIPECLFTLPDLKELLMTFLNLEGVLPETISPSMETFALEGNRFQGTISRELATSPKLKSLVLSHNYISGTLDAFNTGRRYPLDSFNLQLDVNAISGTIPTSLLSLESVNILYGNVFSCADGTKSLPAHDKTTDSYNCGSAGINQILYVLGLLAAVAFVVYLLLRNRLHFKNYKREIFLWLEVVDQRKLIDSNIRTPHILEYQNYLFGITFFASKVCLFICGLGILYLVLGQHRYRIVDHVYSWAVSSAYLYGNTPTFCCLIGWTGLMVLVCLFANQDFSRTKSMMNQHDYARGFVSPLNDQGIKKTRTLRTSYTTFLCALRLCIFFVIVVGVIVAMNALYLYVDRVSSSSVQNLFKLGFAVFKLAWTNMVTQYLFHSSHLYFGIEEKVHDEFVADVFHSKTSVLLLASNLVQFMVPFAVTIILSPACLQLFFNPDPPEKYSYSYEQSIFPIGSAVETVNAETSGPFVYSSNCFSTILITYIPLYGAYLYVDRVSSSSVQTLFKLGFAVFKLAWTNMVTQYLFHTSHLYFGIEEKVHDEFVADVFHSKTSVLLLASNLVQFMVPFAVTIILSPACLQLFFNPDPPEKYSYSYVQSIFPIGSAVETVNAETSGPFVYSSNCFSTILITYIPLYGAMFMMSLAKSFAQLIFLLWSIAYKNDPTAAQRVWYSGLLSAIQFTLPLKNLYLNSKERKKIFVSGTIWNSKDKLWALRSLVHQMDRMLLLVTYGALCPPLGFLILASMIADSYIEKLLMGRFVTREMTAVHEFWNRQELTFAKKSQETNLREVGDSFYESFGIRISSLYCEVGSAAGTSDTDTNANNSFSTFHSSAFRGSSHGSENRRSGSQRCTSFSSDSIGTASRVSGASVISVGAQRASSSERDIGFVYDSSKMRASDSHAPPPGVASTAPEPRAVSLPTLDHHASSWGSQAQHRSIEPDIQDAAQPWGALAALTEVDRQCGMLPVALLKLSNGTFANAQVLLFSFALYDIQNGGGVDKEVSWAVWVMIGIFVCLRLWMILYGLLCEGGRGEKTEDTKTDIIELELELGRVESIENPMCVIEKGSQKSEGTSNAEAPVSSSFPDRGSIEPTLGL